MSDQQPVIKCDSVYKIFGKNAEKMLQDANGKVVAAEFQKAGCVVGVNNASFEGLIRVRCLWLWVFQARASRPCFVVFQD
ncbi:MAG: hypothetical protein CM1200mP30_13810 [Pseudomonadota bacterium]|nr:MAG: hypothetical protein CM1200mP30_13810 [Pseudomonadota bacterium]